MESRKTYSSPLEEAYITLNRRLDAIKSIYQISEDEAADLLQDGYLRLKETPLNDINEAKGKFWTTVKNLAIDKFRSKKQHVAIHEECVTHLVKEDNLEYDCEALIKQMKEILTPIQFKIMKLLIDDFEYSEIAVVLNMTEGAVRTNVSRARKLLKEKLIR